MLNANIGQCTRRAHGCASLWLALAIWLMLKATRAAADALFAVPSRSRLACGALATAVWTALALATGSVQAVTYTVTDLGILGGSLGNAQDINNSGQVVGFSYVDDLHLPTIHAFLYSGGVMTDLNALLASNAAGWVLTSAGAINVGAGSNINGASRAFLLSPTSPEDECLFNWAEANFPPLFAPAGSPTATEAVYTYSHYSATKAYLGVSSVDNNVYYLGPDGKLQDVGPASYLVV